MKFVIITQDKRLCDLSMAGFMISEHGYKNCKNDIQQYLQFVIESEQKEEHTS
jgi:hypothetical protein